MSSKGRLSLATINKNVKAAQYAVRGPIVNRSMELAQKMKKDPNSVPFKKIIACNIGNPQSLEQKPLTFMRDVLSLTLNPSLKDKATFAADVVKRAEAYCSEIPNMGAYTDSQGMLSVRRDVCKFLEERDGFPADPNDIYLTNGASDGVRFCMQTIMRPPSADGARDGVMTPVPQYPLYSALITLLDGAFVPYYLDESKGWNCSVEQLSQSLKKAKSEGITTRALVVINPGNPTGQILSKPAIKEMIQWCQANEIVLMADEVYQENIYKPNSRFVSVRKVAKQMDAFAGDRPLQLISFHSISKGFLGECGLRGGYFELQGIPAEVKAEITKLASINLCSNTVGQVAMGISVCPPKQGDDSFAQYAKERDDILESLRRRAVSVSQGLNALPGVSCTSIDGAMYAFPSIELPAKLIETARASDLEPDAFYCMTLLEETGIVVVPGSGFGQVPGTHHFRTTILPPEDKIADMLELFSTFHNSILNRYK